MIDESLFLSAMKFYSMTEEEFFRTPGSINGRANF